MADEITFEGEEKGGDILYSRFEPSTQTPKMVTWVLSTGIVKNTKAAEYLLLGVAVFAILLAIALPILMTPSNNPTQQDKIRMLTAPGMNPNIQR